MSQLKSNLMFKALVPVFKKYHSNQAFREFMSEFTGTFILLINGFACHVVYKARNETMDTFAAAFCFGIGALIGISASLDVSGAHLNPAVTTALASIGRLCWKKVPYYLAAQYFAAFMAAFVTWFIYGGVVEKFDANYTQSGSSVYTTFPGEGVSLIAAFTDQVLATGLLTFAILAADGPKLARSVHPIFFALVITGIVIAFNYNAGAILNPARDLGPRIFTLIAGYGSDVFKPLSTNYWWLVALVGPHLGGLIGVWYYILFIDPNVVYEKQSLNNNHDNVINMMMTTTTNQLSLPRKTQPEIENSEAINKW